MNDYCNSHIPFGMYRSVAAKCYHNLHPVRDASITGCKIYSSNHLLPSESSLRDVESRYKLFISRALYESSGVKKYWIVHPNDRVIQVYLMQEDGKYNEGTVYEWAGQVPVSIFNNHLIDLDYIFGKR